MIGPLLFLPQTYDRSADPLGGPQAPFEAAPVRQSHGPRADEKMLYHRAFARTFTEAPPRTTRCRPGREEVKGGGALSNAWWSHKGGRRNSHLAHLCPGSPRRARISVVYVVRKRARKSDIFQIEFVFVKVKWARFPTQPVATRWHFTAASLRNIKLTSQWLCRCICA